MMLTWRMQFALIAALAGQVSLAGGALAYTPGTGDLFSADFSSGALAPLMDYPIPAIGFGTFTVRAGEQSAWANGFYGRSGGTGSPGYGQSTTIAPFANPRDYSVAFRLEPEVPLGVGLYLSYVTLRPTDDYSGRGWQFNVDGTGKLFIRRYKGSGQFGPNLAESSAGAARVDSPTDQYVRCAILGPVGSVIVRMKIWNGAPTDEPAAWTIEGVDTDATDLSGSLGAFFNVMYIPPLTSNPSDTTTAGTLIDDIDGYDGSAPTSAVEHWDLYH